MRLSAYADGVHEVVQNFLCPGIRIHKAGPWKEPADIRVSEVEGVPAVLTRSTGPITVSGAQEHLPYPERETLLAYASRAVQQQTRGKRSPRVSRNEAGAE